MPSPSIDPPERLRTQLLDKDEPIPFLLNSAGRCRYGHQYQGIAESDISYPHLSTVYGQFRRLNKHIMVQGCVECRDSGKVQKQVPELRDLGLFVYSATAMFEHELLNDFTYRLRQGSTISAFLDGNHAALRQGRDIVLDQKMCFDAWNLFIRLQDYALYENGRDRHGSG